MQPKQTPVAKPQAAVATAATRQQQPEGQQQKQQQQRRIVPQPIEGAAAAGTAPQHVQTIAAGASPAPLQGMLPGAAQPVLAPGAVQHPCSATQFVDLTAENPAAVMQPQACSESGHTAAGGVSVADGALKRASSTPGGDQQVPGRLYPTSLPLQCWAI